MLSDCTGRWRRVADTIVILAPSRRPPISIATRSLDAWQNDRVPQGGSRLKYFWGAGPSPSLPSPSLSLIFYFPFPLPLTSLFLPFPPLRNRPLNRAGESGGALLQPAGDVSHKPGGRLPLLSAIPAVTPATLKRAATNFAGWCTEARWV